MKSDHLSQPNPRSLGLLTLAILILGVACLWVWMRSPSSSGDPFLRTMNAGKNYLEKGEALKAIEAFKQSVDLMPADADARLNLANAYLLAGQAEPAAQQAQEVLNLDSNSAAAYYVKGCAHLRLGQFEPALQALQESTRLDSSVPAVFFQLGLAHQHLRQWDEAVSAFQMTVSLEPEHPAAHYNMSQALIRLNRQDEANAELELHRQIVAQLPSQSNDPSFYERSVHTQARVPFQIEQPDPNGVAVQFVNATAAAFPSVNPALQFQGPLGVLDIGQDGFQDLFVVESGNQFRLLTNTNGVFTPQGDALPGAPGATYTRCLVGDLQNDRYEDVVVLGPDASHVFKFATNGLISEATPFTRLIELKALDGVLVDLDFTGKTDLLAVTSTNDVQVFRNLGGLLFKDITATSGVPASVTSAQRVIFEDWNNDDIMDLFVARENGAPAFLLKQRGGPFVETNAIPDLPLGSVLASGDLNNDLRVDLVVAAPGRLECILNGLPDRITIPLARPNVTQLALLDYDNDGWLDILAAGDGLQVWRNNGREGFKETTQKLGWKEFAGKIQHLAAADFDFDGDTDFIFDVAGSGLQFWRNDGGNANQQIKLRLIGNRSNASGLGIRIEISSGAWRTTRTVHQLPVEIGVGNRQRLDALTVRWFDLHWNQVDVDVEPKTVLALAEMILPTGSCPYLYVWDGEKFRFVTDLLGASPLGLPVAEGRYIEADPDEYVWMGDESNVRPVDGNYVVQITEELREVLYLDEARLAVVDRPRGVEIYPTDKLLPGKPFPPSELAALQSLRPPLQAVRSDGLDVTRALREADGHMASPVHIRIPQLRGLAEPFSVALDFGPLPTERPLVLAITGWLRFGGGMANIAASHHADFPFPFPRLEVEVGKDQWRPVDVRVGAPAGKTKRVFVDLAGKLPEGSGRLRLSTAFEIHWDQIALGERAAGPDVHVTELYPQAADLHWRGFSEFRNLPEHLPLTPDYDQVRQNANWRITPSGWCTRYGDVLELITRKDDALALLNGGDELTLKFDASRLPAKPEGYVREFFLYTVGWDKDADFHVARGTTVGPLPFHGMEDQLYGRQPRPVIEGDWWMEKYNTRWVGPLTLDRTKAQRLAEARRRR